MLYLPAHGRKLVFYSWEPYVAEASSGNQHHMQSCSQSWWMWTSVSGDKCWCVAGDGRGWLLGQAEHLLTGAGVAVWCRANLASGFLTLSSSETPLSQFAFSNLLGFSSVLEQIWKA